jgi:hypothetical protein
VCSSCEKFQRQDKCLQSPAKPPSGEELNKIQQRKKRSEIKRERQSTMLLPLPPDQMKGLLVESSSDNGVDSVNHSTHHPAKRSQKRPIVSPLVVSADHEVDVDKNHLNVPWASKSSISDPISQEPSTMVPPRSTSDLNIHDKSLPTVSFTRLTHSLTPNSTPVSSLLSKAYSNREHDPNILDINDSDSGERASLLSFLQPGHSVISIIEVNRVKRMLPRDFHTIESLFNVFKKTLSVHLRNLFDCDDLLDKIRQVYLKILAMNFDLCLNVIRTIQFTELEIQSLSVCFLILSTGLQFHCSPSDGYSISSLLFDAISFRPQADIVDDWINISKQLKFKVFRYNNLSDMIYLMQWYCLIHNYYTYTTQLVDDYLEYNSLLNYIVLNTDVVQLIKMDNRVKNFHQVAGFQKIVEFWFYIRIVEIQTPFFQYKGSLLSSNQLKNAILPSMDMLERIYGENLSKINDPDNRSSLRMWGMLCNRKTAASRRDFIQNYLHMYCDYFTWTHERTELYKLNPGISSDDVGLLVSNQKVLFRFIKWLMFVRIENTHFPTLRFASYLTSMLALFNQFHQMDEMCHQQFNHSILDTIFVDCNYCDLFAFYSCLVFQATFLIVLQNFIHDLGQVLDLRYIYDKVLRDFELTKYKFETNSYLKLIQPVKYFEESTLVISNLHDFIHSNVKYNSIHDLIQNLSLRYINDKTWTLLTTIYFGSTDNFYLYMEKLLDLFEKLIQEKFIHGLTVTSNITLDNALLRKYANQPMGMFFDYTTVEEYCKTVVDPNSE